MKDVRVGFESYDGDTIRGHLVFDIKLAENFRPKASCYGGGGFRASTPASVTYCSVVRKDSVRVLLMIAALNDVD